MLTPQDWDAIIADTTDPKLRAEYRYERQRAVEAEERRAKREAWQKSRSEQARSEAATRKWQNEVMRKLREIHAKQFELDAWNARTLPEGGDAAAVNARYRVLTAKEETRNELGRALRAMIRRLERAQREACEGCEVQAHWLELHAELIAAVETWKECRQTG